MKLCQVIHRSRMFHVYQTLCRFVNPFHLPVRSINEYYHIYVIGQSLEVLQLAFFLLQITAIVFKGILHLGQ